MICLLPMFLPWIWYDDMVLDECYMDDMYDSNMLGFMRCHARWVLGDAMIDVC